MGWTFGLQRELNDPRYGVTGVDLDENGEVNQVEG